MKLIRFVHRKVVHLLKNDPLHTCALYNGMPYFYVFDAVATAIVESPVYVALGKIPSTIVAVEYTAPDTSLHVVKEIPVYGYYTHGINHLGRWAGSFLQNNTALLAAFPSKYWAGVQVRNYIVNPRHDLFGQMVIMDIHSIYRK